MKKINQRKERVGKTLASQIQEKSKNAAFVESFILDGNMDIPKTEYELKTEVPRKYFNIKPRRVDYSRYEKYMRFLYRFRFHIDTSDFKRLEYIYNNIHILDQFDEEKKVLTSKLLGYGE